MQLKDYYTTLEVTPLATALQIKKSFRQLALRHHPDKNPGNAYAEAKFREIQEAYEVLSNTGRREEYNYKRWYSRSIKQDFKQEPLTADAVLASCERLSSYMRTVNILQVDYDGLSYHIRQLLNDKNIALVNQSTGKNLAAKVIEQILPCAAPLPYKYIAPIVSLLLRVADNNALLVTQIAAFAAQHKQKSKWQKYRVPIVLAVTVLICILIYFVSR